MRVLPARRACLHTEDATIAPPRSSGVARRRGILIFLRDVVIIILVAVLVSFTVKALVVRSFYIPSD